MLRGWYCTVHVVEWQSPFVKGGTFEMTSPAALCAVCGKPSVDEDAAFCYDCNYAMTQVADDDSDGEEETSKDKEAETTSQEEGDDDETSQVKERNSNSDALELGKSSTPCAVCGNPAVPASTLCAECEILMSQPEPADVLDLTRSPSPKPSSEPKEDEESSQSKRKRGSEEDAGESTSEDEVLEVTSFSPTKIVGQKFKAAEEKGDMICLLDDDEETPQRTGPGNPDDSSDSEIEFVGTVPPPRNTETGFIPGPEFTENTLGCAPLISKEEMETIFETV